MLYALRAGLKRCGMVDMADHRHARLIGQMPEHSAEHRNGRVSARARPRLQNDRAAGLLRRLDKSCRILPAKHHEAGYSITAGHGGAQHIAQVCRRHRNFAIMSLMPGIVSICQAWAGWKNCTSERCDRPPKIVK